MIPTIARGAWFQVFALIVLGTLTLSGMHALVRFVSHEMDPFEIAFFRNLCGFIIFIPWLVRNGIGVLKTDRFGMPKDSSDFFSLIIKPRPLSRG